MLGFGPDTDGFEKHIDTGTPGTAGGFVYPGSMEIRCVLCTRMVELEDASLAPAENYCLDCARKKNRASQQKFRDTGKRKEHRAIHRKRRLRAARIFRRCSYKRCDRSLLDNSRGEVRDTWRLVPVSLVGRRILDSMQMMDIYFLDEDLLLDHFQALCKPCHVRLVEEEEGCRERSHVLQVKRT